MISALPPGWSSASHLHLLSAGIPGPRGDGDRATQASTAALITLLVTAVWVLAVVARPYEWWRVALVTVSGLAYVVIFSIPLAQKTFMLDSSNMAITSMALAIGRVGAAVIEMIWWVQGRILENADVCGDSGRVGPWDS